MTRLEVNRAKRTQGMIKITEQGEVIPSNYSTVGLAVRHLEQLSFGMALAMLDKKSRQSELCEKWVNYMEESVCGKRRSVPPVDL